MSAVLQMAHHKGPQSPRRARLPMQKGSRQAEDAGAGCGLLGSAVGLLVMQGCSLGSSCGS